LRFWSYAAVWFGLSSAFQLVQHATWFEIPPWALAQFDTLSLTLMYLALSLLALGVFDITMNSMPNRRVRWRIYGACLIIALVSNGTI
ncbi:hypothetical protein, partial [Pseudomonas aeruginosa]|uniref:hypothetical protein n=1 Tax=Pseudomonas aeruginosa TaxID=287 RepID=UPI002F939607